jgi:hypothetical protein
MRIFVNSQREFLARVMGCWLVELPPLLFG